MRRNGLVLLALLVPAGAGAHEHNKAVFLGASGRTGSMLWGVHGSFEDVLGKHPEPPKCNPRHLSIVLDASAYFRSQDTFSITVGPRYTFAGSGCQAVRYPKLLFSAYALPGLQKTGGATDDSWRVALVTGLQLDLLLRREDGIRVQVDAIGNVKSDHDVHYRVSAGLLLRFFDKK